MSSFLPLKANSQVKIIVHVADSITKRPLLGATIIAKKMDEVLSFCIVAEQGFCSIEMDSMLLSKSVDIEVQAIGYNNKILSISNLKTDNYLSAIFLSPLQSSDILKPVTVKTKRQRVLRINGDTLSYNVKALTLAADRNIEDVIRRIPGITISTNGQIQYYDKPIAGFTIDQDDVMGQRYALASRNIKPQQVDSIQILQNTQKIKVLQGSMPSLNNYLNIVLNKGAKLKPIVSLQLGGGLPSSYESNFNILSFKDKAKVIGTANFNNTQASRIDEFYELDVDNGTGTSGKVDATPLLSFGTIPQPSIDKDVWLSNQSAAADVHIFKKQKKDNTLQIAGGYISDLKWFNYNGSALYFFPADTIFYAEAGDNRQLKNEYYGHLIFEKNKANNYIQILAKASFSKNSIFGNLGQSNQLIKQSGSVPAYNQSVAFKGIVPLGISQFITLNCNSAFSSLQEANLQDYKLPLLLPLLSDSIYRLVQNVKQNPFKINAEIGWQYLGNFNAFFKSGFEYKRNRILIEQQSQKNSAIAFNTVDSLFNNNSLWQTPNIYVTTGLSKIKPKANYNIEVGWVQLPSHLISGNIVNKQTELGNFIKYNIFARFKIGKESHISLFNSLSPSSGVGDQAITAPIILNYRTIRQNTSYFQYNQSFTSGLNLQYLKSLKLFSANLGLSYETLKNESINATTINNAFSEIDLVRFGHSQNNFKVAGQLSKYIFSLKTNAIISVSFNDNRLPQIQNNTLVNWVSKNYVTNITFRKTLNQLVTLEVSYSFKDGKTDGATLQNKVSGFSYTEQNLALNINGGFENLSFRGGYQIGYNAFNAAQIANYRIINADIQYIVPKSQFSIYCKLLNILSSPNFTEQRSSESTSQFISQFPLRPAQYILGINFNF